MISSFELRGKFYFNLRNKLVDEGIIMNDIFEKDYEFNTPPAVSAVILGRTSNGNVDWINAFGLSLKYINE